MTVTTMMTKTARRPRQPLKQTACRLCEELQNGVNSSKIIEQGSRWSIMLSKYPQEAGHVLVLPSEHHEILSKVPLETLQDALIIVSQVVSVIYDTLNATGVRIQINEGACAGQEVPHLHMHVIPSYNLDKKPVPNTIKSIRERIRSHIPRGRLRLSESEFTVLKDMIRNGMEITR